jgi:hypothetical protein
MTKPTNFDTSESLEVIWSALHSYSEHYEEGLKEDEEEWDNICTAMAWITEALPQTHEDQWPDIPKQAN